MSCKNCKSKTAPLVDIYCHGCHAIYSVEQLEQMNVQKSIHIEREVLKYFKERIGDRYMPESNSLSSRIDAN